MMEVLGWVSRYVLLAALCVVTTSPSFAEAPRNGISSENIVRLRDLDGLAVSPDGRWAVFQVREADPESDRYDQAWLVLSTNGGAASRLADGGEPIQPAAMGRVNGLILAPIPVWSPDSRWIAYLRKDRGRVQIWRVRREGGRAEQVTRNNADVRSLVFSADGRTLLYETEPSAAQIEAELAEEGRAGFLYDGRFFPSYRTTPVMPADAAFNAADTSTNSADQERLRSVWAYDIANRRERAATESERAAFTDLLATPRPEGRAGLRGDAVASRAGALAWTEARDPDQQGGMPPLTIVAQVSGVEAPVACSATECTGQRMKGLWWNGDEVIFARGDGVLYQDTALYAWRPGESAPRLLLRSPDLFAASFEWKCASARGKLICFYEQPNHPRRLVAIDLVSGALATLYDPNPDFGRFDVGAPPRRVEFASPLAGVNYGYLVTPSNRRPGERLPLVIVTYRCSGFLRGGTGDEYPIFPMVAQGMAVLCFNTPDTDFPRLARMDWGPYQNWSRGPGDPGKRRVQEGLDAAIARLDAMGIVDPNRVGITGLSFGAETVGYALFHMPNLAAAIATSVGLEPSSSFLYGPAGRRLLHAWGLGAPTSERWNDLAVSRNAERVRAPLLLNVADREMISSLQPLTALQDAGRAVEMHVFPDEYHIKWRPAHRLAIYERNVDWMNFWLRDVEDPAPEKAQQYERWRALRALIGGADRTNVSANGPSASAP